MKTSIAAKLAQLTRRLDELDQLLSAETATANLDSYRKLTREHAEVTLSCRMVSSPVCRLSLHAGS